MDLHVNRQGKLDVGIVFQRGLMQFWVPSTMQKHLPYSPNQLPTQKFPDLVWYYMWFETLKLAYLTDNVDLNDKLLIEVLRR